MKFFISFLLIFVNGDFLEDLGIIEDHFSCDPTCTFNQSEVTSKTIKFFPDCDEICGILILNSNLDLSESEIRQIFRSMTTLYGGIVFENTQLLNINFFQIDRVSKEFNLFCEKYGFFIRNNSKLADISMLNQFNLWGDQDMNPCDFRIENNEKLDVRKYYTEQFLMDHFLDVKTSENLKDYGCRGDQITSSNIVDYKNCEILFGGLKLYNIPDFIDLSFLSNVHTIVGKIDIRNCSFQDLSFLKNLKLIQFENVGLVEKVSVNIQNCPQMTKLGFLSDFEPIFAFSWTGNQIFNFENLHPDFCLTIEEMSQLSGFRFTNLHAKYCTETGSVVGTELCKFKSMKNLYEFCYSIWGDLLIESGDEKFVSKLSQVMQIYGSLTVRGTDFESLDFFPMLTIISSLDKELPAIRILENRKLQNAYLPAVENIISRSGLYIEMENNHPTLFNT